MKINSKINNRLKNTNIKSVTLIGVTNQCVDFKLHAILNFQEDIYANVYSFSVTYENGATEIIQTYNEDEVSFLMSIAESSKNETSLNNESSMSESQIYDDLTKLESLHESGIIPDDLFEEKKKALLDQLTDTSIKVGTIIIKRANQLSGSLAPVTVTVDGKNKLEMYCNNTIKVEVPYGTHNIKAKFWSNVSNFAIAVNKNNPEVQITYKIDLKNKPVLVK